MALAPRSPDEIRGAEIAGMMARYLYKDRFTNLYFVLRHRCLPWMDRFTAERIEWSRPPRYHKSTRGLVIDGRRVEAASSAGWILCCGHTYSRKEVEEMVGWGLITLGPGPDFAMAEGPVLGASYFNVRGGYSALAECERNGLIPCLRKGAA